MRWRTVFMTMALTIVSAVSAPLCFVGGRGSGTNDTVKRYSRGGLVMFDRRFVGSSVRLQVG